MIEPGKRPRVTLTPTLAMKDGQPWMAFSVQGGDSQDQNLLQCFLNIVEFGMTPQQAVEAPNMNSFQMMNSFQDHTSQPGRMLVAHVDAAGRARRAAEDGLHAAVLGAHVRSDHRDLVRSQARHDVGRGQQSRRGLRDRLVTFRDLRI